MIIFGLPPRTAILDRLDREIPENKRVIFSFSSSGCSGALPDLGLEGGFSQLLPAVSTWF